MTKVPNIVVWEADGNHVPGRAYGRPLAEQLRRRGHRVTVVPLTQRSPDSAERRAPFHVLSGGDTPADSDTPWVRKARLALASVIERAADGKTDVVGICFGAQLLATALGGPDAVGASDNGIEVGLARVARKQDPGGDRWSEVVAQFHHHQISADSVVRCGGRIVLTNEHSEVQAFEVGNHITGYQFHPEWSPADMVATIGACRATIQSTGGSPDDALASVAERYGHWDPSTFDRLVASTSHRCQQRRRSHAPGPTAQHRDSHERLNRRLDPTHPREETMCGIAVISNADESVVRAMLAELRHRGPDHTGVHLGSAGSATMGHTRLAIMDPHGGDQPMVSADGAVAVSNGEIYNHLDLRDGLGAVDFANDSDAAVLLPLFAEHGDAVAEQLDGMFAFVVAAEDGTLVAARDRLGIKPLYRATDGVRTAYASEMRPLLEAGFADVATVPPGHMWVGDELQRYWSLPEARTDGSTSTEDVRRWCGELREALEAAVVKRLMSDVPLGAFLSGGLDSSIIAALAVRHEPGLATFALGFEDSADLCAARDVAKHLGTTHHEIVVTEEEALAVLPEVLRHLESWDRDLVRSALPTYLVAEFASRSVKVVLTGEGADELFAGYAYHRSYSEDTATLQHELHRSVAAMHDSNLQRVDRMTMAHSLEARVPFLDPAVVEVAMQIPGSLKLRQDRGVIVDKWILREAFADLLPPEISARPKAQFDEGSGTAARLPMLAAAAMGDRPEPAAGARVRDIEEAWYFDQMRAEVDDWRPLQRNTSVWTEGRLEPLVGPRALRR